MARGTIDASKAVVRRFLAAIEGGDLATIEELQAPDCTWWILGAGEMSRAQYGEAVRQMLLSADARRVEIIGLVAEGEIVAAEIRSELHFGEQIYANEYHDVFVVRHGQIVHGREYFDTAKVQAFFGHQQERQP